MQVTAEHNLSPGHAQAAELMPIAELGRLVTYRCETARSAVSVGMAVPTLTGREEHSAPGERRTPSTGSAGQ
jgi:hypothetical protein